MRNKNNKFSQGIYIPENSRKYVGKKAPRFRSSWEKIFCKMCDSHPNVEQWASEPVRIPYINPGTGRKSTYVPDFLIQYRDKAGKKHRELIEIKPYGQTTNERAKNQMEKNQAIINKAKWQAAFDWSKKYGLKFRVITEKDIFLKK